MKIGVLCLILCCLYHNLKRNLFSLAKAIDRSMIDVYDKKHCKLYANCVRGSLLLASSIEGKIRKLQFKVVLLETQISTSNTNFFTVVESGGVTFQLWHNQLTRIRMDMIK
jgi:hypothetical protein